MYMIAVPALKMVKLLFVPESLGIQKVSLPVDRQLAAVLGCKCNVLIVLGQGEAGCCRQVAASHSDHFRQVLLYMILLDQGRLAAVDRWLPHTVTPLHTDRFKCTNHTQFAVCSCGHATEVM